ncbi:hypothetical protein MK280_19925 [Myxococcota bacterium]|nr:hypothetical protein [Myxococcota bacterium]
MAAVSEYSPKGVSRHRHRSYGRKVAQSIALVFGTPVLLFVLLALSVDAIEYAPSASSSVVAEAVPAAPSEIAGERVPEWLLREKIGR